MITWTIGQTGAGKTTLARHIISTNEVFENSPYKDCVWLDGDNMRGVWNDLKFSKEDRWENNLRIARLAKVLHEQGHNVIVSVICPYKKLRKEVKDITNCKFIYIEGWKKGKDFPFERPELY